MRHKRKPEDFVNERDLIDLSTRCLAMIHDRIKDLPEHVLPGIARAVALLLAHVKL